MFSMIHNNNHSCVYLLSISALNNSNYELCDDKMINYFLRV